MLEDNTTGEKVVLCGTITEIQPSKGPHPHQKWLAILAIDAVMEGRFSNQTFAFRIHSPTKSGIVVGGRYVIQAERIQPDEYLLKKIEPWPDETT